MYLLKIDIELSVLIGLVFMTIFALIWLISEFRRMRDELKERAGINNESLKLRLQAYERLTLFSERAGLKNLVDRTDFSGIGAGSFHAGLIENIKTEYDYNLSQQIYVSTDVWNAVTKLKDQNIYIINQLAATLPHQATGIDLAKRILEYSLTEKAELNKIVLDAIQFEAKKAF